MGGMKSGAAGAEEIVGGMGVLDEEGIGVNTDARVSKRPMTTRYRVSLLERFDQK